MRALCQACVYLMPILQTVEAIDTERDILQAELDSKAEQIANLTEELELGHQQADDANRQAHVMRLSHSTNWPQAELLA